MLFKINLLGKFCNEWPNCQININDSVIDNFAVVNFVSKEYIININELNTLAITHYGKRFGENRIWDTKLVNGQIQQDRNFKILDIEFDDVSIADLWHHGKFSESKLQSTTISQFSESLYFNDNVTYTLFFKEPVYTWIIDKRNEGYKGVGPAWRRSKLDSQPDGYSISNEEAYQIINAIKKDIELL